MSTEGVDARSVMAGELDGLVRSDRVSGRLYTDPATFELEMSRIHHKSWMFVAHESEVADTGEFVTRRIGRQPVVVVRGDDGTIGVFANRCPHRGATVCPAPHGQTRFLRCPYHGWTFDTAGALVALPAEGGFGDGFDRSDYGLAPVPRVESYRGFVFASAAPDGPSLADHLGAAHEMLDRLCDLSPIGEVDLRAGWLRHRVRANWKIAAENVCDFYHPPITHASSGLAATAPAGLFSDSSGGVARDLGGGHGEVDFRSLVADAAPRVPEDYSGSRRDHIDRLVARDGPAGAVRRVREGPPHGFIFPNLFIAEQNVFVIEPLSVDETSHLQAPLRWVGLSEEAGRRQIRRFEGGFGPAGMVEPDDSAVWERIQEGLAAENPEWVRLERGADPGGPGDGRLLDEIAMRGFWRHYRSLLTGPEAAT